MCSRATWIGLIGTVCGSVRHSPVTLTCASAVGGADGEQRAGRRRRPDPSDCACLAQSIFRAKKLPGLVADLPANSDTALPTVGNGSPSSMRRLQPGLQDGKTLARRWSWYVSCTTPGAHEGVRHHPDVQPRGLGGRRVASVLAQRFEVLELIVVDDGSTDDTASRLGSHSRRPAPLRSRPHAGVSAARNLGCASAPPVTLISPFWIPTISGSGQARARGRGASASHPEVDAVFSDLEKRHGDRVFPSFMRETAVFSRRLPEASIPMASCSTPRELRCACSRRFRSSRARSSCAGPAFDRVGGFDETWSSSEDWEFSCSAWPAPIASPTSTGRWPCSTSRPTRCTSWISRGARGDDPAARPRAREPDRRRRGAGGRPARAGDAVKHFGWHYAGPRTRARAFRVFSGASPSPAHPGSCPGAGRVAPVVLAVDDRRQGEDPALARS